jgi:hypothetical protein
MFPQIQEDKMPLPGQRMKHGSDDSLLVRFGTCPKYLPELSRIEGRDCYSDTEMVEFVEIRVPGGDVQVYTSASPEFEPQKKRFAHLYRQWKLNEGENPGTPFEVLGLTEVQKDMLTRVNIHSVEQLAAVGDNVLASIGIGAINMRARAQRYIQAQPIANTEVEELKAQNAALTEKLEQLTEIVKTVVEKRK